MTPGLMAMLLGVFVVPATLLWMGHRLRRRPPRWRSMFWGALIGHVIAAVIGLIWAMLPPEEWAATDYVRGTLAFWSFLILPIVGAFAGWLRARRGADSSLGSE